MPIHDWTRVEAGVFHHFHTTWIPDIKRALIGLLPADYYAMVEQVASGLIPDVITLQRGHGSNGRHRTPAAPVERGGVMTLSAAPPQVRYRAVSESEIYATKARTIVVRHSSDDRVVAMIEIVSPGNKQNRAALRSFVEKSVELLRVGIHLLIVDLFPPGPRDPRGIHSAIWSEVAEDDYIPPAEQPLTLVSYQAGELLEAFIQPAAVGEPLPIMPLFLEPGSYINLPLEPSYQSAYATVPPHWRETLEAAA